MHTPFNLPGNLRTVLASTFLRQRGIPDYGTCGTFTIVLQTFAKTDRGHPALFTEPPLRGATKINGKT